MTSLLRGHRTRPRWPREQLRRGVVEYKRDATVRALDGYPKGERVTSYMVATLDGLLLGSVFSRRRPGYSTLDWWATGWTPATDGRLLGPFETRWEAFQALYDIEQYGRWPARWRIKSIDTTEAAA